MTDGQIMQGSGRRLRVLSVDDDDSLQGVIELLYGGAYDLDEVGTIAAARAALREGFSTSGTRLRYDVLILDIHLPDGKGTDLLRALRHDPALAHYRELPVVLMSASEALEDHEASFDQGGVTFVQKPFEAARLTEAIETALAAA